MLDQQWRLHGAYEDLLQSIRSGRVANITY